MSYEGDRGQVSGIYRPRSAVQGLQGPTGETLFVAPGSVTRRQFGLFRRDITPRGGGADPHFHRTFSESFYVISGTVRLYDGSGWVDATAGDFLYVPKGGIHGFSNDADEPASLLILFAPGYARERYFIALDEMRRAGTKLEGAERTAFLASHDQYMVEEG
jgi:mannose-6-phosphate isomerase-like protein (cupin superfamily)